MSANNMYRVGDYVYVDAGPTEPFAVRRIDELQKSASGNVEVRWLRIENIVRHYLLY